VQINLVSTRIDVSESDAATLDELRARWQEFLIDLPTATPASADYSLRAVADPSVQRDTGDPEVHVVRKGERWEITRQDFVGSWDARARRAELRYSGYLSSFSSFVRVLLAITLREHGGALFHSASVAVGDEAILFPGVSGTGKSTIASLAAPRGILSDEISGLRIRDGRVWAFPTPFWGDLVRTRAADAAPLQRIVLLARGAGSDALTPATSAAAFAALLEGALFFDEGPVVEDRRAFAASLLPFANLVPCAELRFDLPSNPWRLLDS
jgi:hypothetical protein